MWLGTAAFSIFGLIVLRRFRAEAAQERMSRLLLLKVISSASISFPLGGSVFPDLARFWWIVLLTHSLGSYGPAARRKFPDAVHVSGVGLQRRLNNNRMERYHGTFKERNKVVRAIKTENTATLDGQRVYYNYITARHQRKPQDSK
jgi:hypothetical protein